MFALVVPTREGGIGADLTAVVADGIVVAGSENELLSMSGMIELIMRVVFSVTGSIVVLTGSVVVVDAVFVWEAKVVRDAIMELKSVVIEVSTRGASVMLYTLLVGEVLNVGVVVLKSKVFVL